MAGLFARIFKQWAEEAVVNKLADSAAFQKVAVSAVGAAQEAQRLATAAAADPTQITNGLSAFWGALKAEAAKDLGGGAPAAAAAPAAPPASATATAAAPWRRAAACPPSTASPLTSSPATRAAPCCARRSGRRRFGASCATRRPTSRGCTACPPK